MVPMPIMIDGRRYKVGKAAYSVANVFVDPDGSASTWRHTFKRKDGPEKDALFQARVQAAVIKMRRAKVRDPTGVVIALAHRSHAGLMQASRRPQVERPASHWPHAALITLPSCAMMIADDASKRESSFRFTRPVYKREGFL